jgi:nickel superoxide dismutase
MELRCIGLVGVGGGVLASAQAWAHCEIPCGIYDGPMRIQMIEEHITTIERSLNQITELVGRTPVNYNQLLRWVANKEHHANEIQAIVSQYFMTQRIKPDAENYQEKLTVLHKMLLAAMRSKQTTELANVNELRSLTKEFAGLYFGSDSSEQRPEAPDLTP